VTRYLNRRAIGKGGNHQITETPKILGVELDRSYPLRTVEPSFRSTDKGSTVRKSWQNQLVIFQLVIILLLKSYHEIMSLRALPKRNQTEVVKIFIILIKLSHDKRRWTIQLRSKDFIDHRSEGFWIWPTSWARATPGCGHLCQAGRVAEGRTWRWSRIKQSPCLNVN